MGAVYHRAHDGGGGNRELRVGEYAADDIGIGECIFRLPCGVVGSVLGAFAWKKMTLKKRSGFPPPSL